MWTIFQKNILRYFREIAVDDWSKRGYFSVCEEVKYGLYQAASKMFNLDMSFVRGSVQNFRNTFFKTKNRHVECVFCAYRTVKLYGHYCIHCSKTGIFRPRAYLKRTIQSSRMNDVQRPPRPRPLARDNLRVESRAFSSFQKNMKKNWTNT